jgi:phosphoadenosine phosphosulfate reductase
MQDWEREQYLLHSQMRQFKNKVQQSKEIIKKALEITEKWVISCSFGKDSIVLLDLVYHIKPCKVIMSDSGYQLPETYKTREEVEKKFKFKTLILPQLMPFEQFLKEFGLPGINRTEAQHKKVVEATKKHRLDDFAKENGAKGIFWGLRAEESRGRKMLLGKHHTYYNNSRDTWFSAPLYNWTANDIWAYIISNDLPYPEFYDYQDCGKTRDWIRNTSWTSTDGANEGRIIWLKKHYPQLYLRLEKEFPEIRQYL